MNSSRVAAAMMATVFSLACAASAQAEVTSQTVTTVTSSEYGPTPMAVPVASTASEGQDQSVSYDNKVAGIGFGKNISKTVTIEPGNHQISLDGLGWRDRVNLTLVNPSSTPLQFETTQRWGKQVVAVVAPHSQQVVSFKQSRPITHEVRYAVMQLPSNAIATNMDYVTQQTASVTAVQQTAIRNLLEQQTAMMRESQELQTAQLEASQKAAIQEALLEQRQKTEGRAAVRGFW